MFQLLRRVSGSFLPRPDRPWRDDATSHAPTIGRKRRHSSTEHDGGSTASTPKRTKNDPVKPDTDCDSSSEGDSPAGDAAPRQDVREVTKGVKKVDLEDKDKPGDASSIRPEGVPLPDSPSGSPEPESVSTQSDEVEETEDQEDMADKDSVASSAPEANAEALLATTSKDASADEIVPAREVTAQSGLHDTPETLEVKA